MARAMLLAMFVMILTVISTTMVEAQIPDCASKLVDCADYLNSTKPPESCCKPLKEAVLKQHACLCDLYENPTLLSAFSINITQALELPQYCGVSSDVSSCKNSTAAAPTAGTKSSPPPAAGNTPTNGGSKMAWAGTSSLVLFWVSVMV